MNELIIAKLTDEQIAKAKEVNGNRKKITHILICGTYGQLLGTEKQCLKYYMPWKKIFKELFTTSKKLESINNITDYTSTFNLVIKLQEEYDKLPVSSRYKYKKMIEEYEQEKNSKPLKESWLKRLFKF